MSNRSQGGSVGCGKARTASIEIRLLYFFTMNNCAGRHENRLLMEHIGVLRQVFRKVKGDHPFTIDAVRRLTASYA